MLTTGLPTGIGLLSSGSIVPAETPASYLPRTHERWSGVNLPSLKERASHPNFSEGATCRGSA